MPAEYDPEGKTAKQVLKDAMADLSTAFEDPHSAAYNAVSAHIQGESGAKQRAERRYHLQISGYQRSPPTTVYHIPTAKNVPLWRCRKPILRFSCRET